MMKTPAAESRDVDYTKSVSLYQGRWYNRGKRYVMKPRFTYYTRNMTSGQCPTTQSVKWNQLLEGERDLKGQDRKQVMK